jgi:hypothetical protein
MLTDCEVVAGDRVVLEMLAVGHSTLGVLVDWAIWVNMMVIAAEVAEVQL